MLPGANILLAHFHYCNKGVHPFSDECKDSDLRTLAGLTEEQIQFIHETRTYVKQKSKFPQHGRASRLIPCQSSLSTEFLEQR